ncbi:TPA: hypothetical protein ACKQCU_001603 [Streptococcus pyogenes]|uniref:Uncharacterized protein n=2 Tax=Streptococcus pyogenes TaxID=1314 RepID=A0A5S4TI15_STRPY|nr:hypothetical protein [Streptococcus pyogenes]NP_795453.1 hypothetical protein SpyM3_0954 [Streptococcus phage 315.2]QBX19368.1 hypothetical protein Javan483_0036 [Streptococcus phage Javan483]QBX29658.1 hypothetical protein Javan508_0035 [Streptococcus phage Javan508]HEP6174364.1 hypothetical protein [Streptococcus pyogenes ABC020026425]HEP6178008.1 hypothetical protein [Streptococcus pyogenes ABC020015306]HEP6195170.1 hypothetical protein [Streptococcus pyogenes ABC020035469]HEP6208998.1
MTLVDDFYKQMEPSIKAFLDDNITIADHLNDFIDKNKYAKVTVVGYQVVQLSPYGRDLTYILAEVEE